MKQISLGGSARQLLANIPPHASREGCDEGGEKRPIGTRHGAGDAQAQSQSQRRSKPGCRRSDLKADSLEGLEGILFTPFDRELAVRYNDSSPLENMHLAVTFSLLRRENNCFLNPETLASVRALLVQAVLGTDMAKHAETMTRLEALIENQEALQAVHSQQSENDAAAASDGSDGTSASPTTSTIRGDSLGRSHSRDAHPASKWQLVRKASSEGLLNHLKSPATAAPVPPLPKQVIPWYWPAKPPPSAKDEAAVSAWEIKLQEGFIVELFLHAADIGSPVSKPFI